MQGYDGSTYGDAFADVYDDWYGDISDVDALVGLVAELSRNAGTSLPIVELGVGTGRIALPLAAAVTPTPVIGLDTSAAMLDRLDAKRAARLAGNDDSLTNLHVALADMVAGLPNGPLGVVFVAFNTFFNLTSAELQQRCFDAVAQRLAPGGSFVIEAYVPDDHARRGSSVEVKTLATDRVVLSVTCYDGATSRIDGQFVEFTESNGVRLRPWSIRYTLPDELDAMAVSAGLECRARWEDAGRQPFDADSNRHVSVYVRQNGNEPASSPLRAT